MLKISMPVAGRCLVVAATGLLPMAAGAQDAQVPPEAQGRAEAAAPAGPVASIPVDGTTPPAPATETDGADTRELPTVYVTAQKVRQSLEEVPASVSTISAETMRDTGSTGIQQMQSYAANINLRLTPATSDFYVRGFGTDSSNAGFEPSVASVVDGIYYGRSIFLAMFFNDLDRLEILRGPQGTLFGKNSSAGVLNITTVAPKDEFGAKVEMLVDSSGQKAIKPVLNIPLFPDVAMRLSGSFADDRGMLKNTDLDRREGGVEQQTGRMRIRWDPEGAWSFDLAGFYSHQAYNNNLFQLSEVGPNMLDYMRTFDPQIEPSAKNFRGSSNVAARGVVDFSGASLTFEDGLDGVFGFDTLSFTSLTGYSESVIQRRDFDADFSPVPVIRDSLAHPSPYRQVSQEVRFAGTRDDLFGVGHQFKFVVGGYYFYSTLYASDIFQLEDLGATAGYLIAANADSGGLGQVPGGIFGGLLGGAAGPITSLADLLAPLLNPVIGEDQSALVQLRQKTEANAAFGQAEWSIVDDLWLIGGLRVGREQKQGHASSFTNSTLIPAIANQKNHDTHLHRNEREVSPKAGMRWQPSSALNLYWTFSQGYKSGGYNALPLNDQNLDFDPEKATSYEVGAKARLLGGSLSVGAAVFDTRFEDLQVSTFRGGNFIILNAAKARSRGAELDLNWLPPIPGTMLTGSFGYIDAHYLSYKNAPAPADSGNDPPLQDLTGRRLAITPRYSATIIPSFTLPTPFLGGPTTFALDNIYRSGRFLDVDLDRRTYQSATYELNARVTFGDEDGAWRMTLGAKNLTRERILDQVLDEPLAPGNFGAIRGDRGRYWSAVVTVSYE